MKILITGGAGFLRQKLCQQLLQLPQNQAPMEIVLSDLQFEHSRFANHKSVQQISGDFSTREMANALATRNPDVIFHLAAIVSGQAEQEFETGMRVNFNGTLNLLEALRTHSNKPRFIFSSSCAVYGGELPAVTTDHTIAMASSSYGAQKNACEILLNDYARKGYVQGLSLRLPTVVVRPGKPNAAASSFASGIIREPLCGIDAICPVSVDTELWITSPSTVVNNLIHAMNFNYAALKGNTIVPLPGITVSVKQMIEALKMLTSEKVSQRIHFNQDRFIQSIVYSWPAHFKLERCYELGFEADRNIREIIAEFIAVELSGSWV